jgi:hypothetical protein
MSINHNNHFQGKEAVKRRRETKSKAMLKLLARSLSSIKKHTLVMNSAKKEKKL